MTDPHDITSLLERWKAGEEGVSEEVFGLLYPELRAIAGGLMKGERPDHTLQPTALANEAYLRMARVSGLEAYDRAHFLALVARVARRVLVEHSREHARRKRGGDFDRAEFTDPEDLGDSLSPEQLVDLDNALRELGEINPEAVRLVELRYFGGLTLQETAEAMVVSKSSVQRTWRFAQAWLFKKLRRT